MIVTQKAADSATLCNNKLKPIPIRSTRGGFPSRLLDACFGYCKKVYPDRYAQELSLIQGSADINHKRQGMRFETESSEYSLLHDKLEINGLSTGITAGYTYMDQVRNICHVHDKPEKPRETQEPVS